jgi:hypothetical protein
VSKCLSVLTFVLAGLVVAGPAAAAPRPRAAHLSLARLGTKPVVRIRDTTVRGARPTASAASAPYGGDIRAADGETVTVFLSPRYAPSDSQLQSVANFFAGLVHGPELADLTVYIAPFDEVTAVCGNDADACYDPRGETMALPGTTPPDGTPLEEAAAHEYGHHIARNRTNAPWDASNYGPKYWSTQEGVCAGVRAGRLFPGDEGANYSLNPGEAWAETYRVLNGGTEAWTRIAAGLFPDAGALRWARQDILNPFPGNTVGTTSGRFRRGHASRQSLWVPVENDGSVTIRLAGARGLDADLALYAGGRPVARATHAGRAETLRYRSCGYRRLKLRIHRAAGYGRFRLRASLPYDNQRAG